MLSLLAAAFLIHNVTVIDPASRSVRPSMDVRIEGERIAAVVPSGGRAPSPVEVIDGTGKYLLPGLIDMHVHLLAHAWDDKGNLRPRYDRASVEQMLKTLVAFGVTTVRDPGSETEAAVTFRKLTKAPEIVTCGRILNASNFDSEPFQPVPSAEDVRREIRWQKAAGVDCIKVYASMPPDLVAAAIDEAHKNKLPVIGHLQRTTWTEAARLGIDGVEHAAPWSPEYVNAPGYEQTMFGRVFWLEHLDSRKIDEMVAELAKHRVVVDPTLMAFQTKFFGDRPNKADLPLAPPLIARGWQAFTFTKEWTPEQYRAAHAAWPKLLALTKKIFDAGVPMVAGTDAPTPWIVAGPSLHDELLLLHEAGIPAMDVLRMATINAAAALHRGDLGAIRAGAVADVILLSKNPLDDLKNTRSILRVWKRGEAVP